MKIEDLIILAKAGFSKDEILGFAQNQTVQPTQNQTVQSTQNQPVQLAQTDTNMQILNAINALTATIQAGNVQATGTATQSKQRTESEIMSDMMSIMN